MQEQTVDPDQTAPNFIEQSQLAQIGLPKFDDWGWYIGWLPDAVWLTYSEPLRHYSKWQSWIVLCPHYEVGRGI